jgi:aryl-alcohol dehydrogenase-like predicted oxidoreductase
MMFGPGGNEDRDQCVGMVHRALDAGINFIDTADVYGRGASEEVVGRALQGRRDEVVLATKVHGRMGGGPNERGNSRLWIMREVEASLRRLGTNHIDLYQLHRPDVDAEIDETLEALTDLVRQGKVRYAGTSAFPAFMLVEAHRAAERRRLVRPACEQVSYSILVRHAERDVFEVARRYGMGVIAYSPLAGGWLTGKYRPGSLPEDSRGARATRNRSWAAARFDESRPPVRRKFEVVDRLGPVAEKAGLSPTHLAMAFTLAHPAMTSAIVGPRTPEQLEDLLEGADVRLEPDVLDAIDEVVPPGTTIDEETDRGWDPPWLAPAARRRPPR